MKFTVTMKTPDALDDAILAKVKSENYDLSNREIKDIAFDIDVICKRWFAYSECVQLEIDTDAGTCVVIERKRCD